MKEKLYSKGLSLFKIIFTSILCLFSLLSIVYVSCTTNELFGYFYCISVAFFVAFPPLFTLLFHWKMNTIFYIFFSLYALGPILGAVYNLYYILPWWDDLLHFMAGTVFAVIGAKIFIKLNKKEESSLPITIMFGVMFSITIAVFWEFYEFGSDILLGSDMQADTIINIINTKINSVDGSVSIFENITETLVNGQSLGINGYLDIGLFDTMTDIIGETLGALVYIVFAIINNKKAK